VILNVARKKFSVAQQNSIAIGESDISLELLSGSDGNARRFLLPNRSKPIFSGFLNCLGCRLKKILLTPKAVVNLVAVVASDSAHAHSNCFMTSHG
jgi:hypothetical protein